MDIMQFPGVAYKVRQHLRACGVTTVEQLAAFAPDELTRFKGIKTTAPAVHAHARAYCEGRPIWYRPLPEPCLQSGVMFDLETDPMTGEPWSWGYTDSTGDATQIIVAPNRAERAVSLPDGRQIFTVPTQTDAWFAFAEAVAGSEPIYHWTGFDAGITRGFAPPEVRDYLLNRMHDLHGSFKGCVKFPVGSNSLKVVARYLHFEWEEYDAWDAAWNDYRHWLRDSTALDALARSANYQRADVLALDVVWRWLNENRE